MKKLTAIAAAFCLLFATAFAVRKGAPQIPDTRDSLFDSLDSLAPPADSLRSVYLYTEAVAQNAIYQDTVRARRLLTEAIQNDSTFAPAYYELAASGMYGTPDEAVALAQHAYERDTTNKWYRQLLGQTLIYAKDYDKALNVYQGLCAADPQNPDNYRLLAALYEQVERPYSALGVLDSAEVRFGRIPMLGTMKRELLVSTRQYDRAVAEAQSMIDAAPYDPQNQVALANLYALQNKDSLAQATYDRALQIDSTNTETLAALIDYYNQRNDYTAMLAVTQKLFASPQLPLDPKIRNFERLTSDTRFYREYYPQIDALASILTVRYPNDSRVVELYAKHLIASGELEQALAFYKLHLDDQPPVENYYRMVIDGEGYLQRPDSVTLYVDRALKLFPDQPDFHLAEGNVLAYAKKYDAAVGKYKASLQYADSDSLRSVIWGMIGDMQHQQAIDQNGGNETHFTGKSRSGAQQALKSYQKSLQYDPDNIMVLNNYAYFLAQEGRDLNKALDMSGRVIAKDNNPTYLDTYGWILFKLGRAAEAKKTIQQAVALDSQGSPELLVHYGDILHALGEQFMAETYWQKALDKGYDAAKIKARLQQPAVQKPE